MKYPNKIATIGVFDGVHLGHQFLIQELKRLAVEQGLSPLVVTFPESPSAYFCPDYPTPLLTTWDEKGALLRAQGVEVLGLSFNADLAGLTARDFLTLLRDRHQVLSLLMGYDHRFGSDHADFSTCRQLATELGMQVFLAPQFSSSKGDQALSSSLIRRLIQAGQVAEANELLGHPYSLQGTVVHGYGNGHDLGFPTANLQVNPRKCLPKNGVYIVRDGLLNIGCRPTVTPQDHHVSIEVHLPDFSGSLYDQELRVELLAFLRPERRFDTQEQLIEQIQKDLCQLRAYKK